MPTPTVPDDAPPPRVSSPPPPSPTEGVAGPFPTCIAGEPVEATVDPRDAQGVPLGRYRLLEELGQGGMGIVWRAWDLDLKRYVALKAVRPDRARDNDLQERFLREARLAAGLRHPRIVQVHDVGRIDEQPYFTSDFIQGKSLDDALEEKPPVRKAVEWIHGVAEALAYAHEHGVVHRDVKPTNILIDEAGEPLLTDFGLAKEVVPDAQDDAPLTLSGAILGTPQYMSPEQARGDAHGAGPASDQFSLGVVLYEAITGVMPFGGTALQEVLNAVTDLDPAPPTRLSPHVHRDLETICLKALEKDPARRYASMSDLAADLGRHLDGEPILARPLSVWGRLARKASKHRRALIPLAAALAVLVGLGVRAIVRGAADRAEVARSLDAARSARARGDVEAARNAFLSALEVDSSCTEAREGLSWADETARSATERAAYLRSSRVGNVLLRWTAIVGTIAKLRAAILDDRLDDAKRQEATEPPWKEVEAFMAATPPDRDSQAVMRALAGWARVAAGRHEEGRAWIRRAQEEAPDLPYGAAMEALALLGRYIEEQGFPMTRSLRQGLAFVAQDESAELRSLREEIDRQIALASATGVFGEGVAAEMHAALAGLTAFQAARGEEADALLSASLEAPSLIAFRTDLRLARARARYLSLEFAKAIEDLEAVRSAFAGWGTVHTLLCRARQAEGMRLRSIGEEVRPILRQAVADAAEVVRLRPASAASWNLRAQALLALTQVGHDRGEDIQPTIDRGLEDLAKAESLGGYAAELHGLRGHLHQLDAIRLMGKMQDARGSAERAVADFDRALRAAPGSVDLVRSRASALWLVGHCSYSRAEDPSAQWLAALAGYDEALRLEPDSPDTHFSRGFLRNNAATVPMDGSRTPAEWIRLAIEDLEEAVRLLPQFFEARGLAADCWGKLGDIEEREGRDGRETYRKSAVAAGEVARAAPFSVEAHYTHGSAWQKLAGAIDVRSEDALEANRNAVDAFTAALERKPDHVDARFSRAQGWVGVAEGERRRGGDPSAAIEAAGKDLDEVERVQPGFPPLHAVRGRLHECAGRIDDAEREYEAMLKMCPGEPDTTLRLTRLRNRRKGPR